MLDLKSNPIQPTHLIHFSCADASRLPMLWAALASIISSGKDFGKVAVRICYNAADDAIYTTNCDTGLRCFEKHFHSIVISKMPDVAVPSMFCSSVAYAVRNNIRMVAKLDDDCFYYNLHVFLCKSTKEYNCMCFWDQSNARKYPDWFDKNTLLWDNDVKALVAKHGEQSLWAQRWSMQANTYATRELTCKVNASLFCVDAAKLFESKAFLQLLAIPPKTRGMDAIVPLAFDTKTLHPYAYGEHYGIWRPQLDQTYWTGYTDGYSVESGWQK